MRVGVQFSCRGVTRKCVASAAGLEGNALARFREFTFFIPTSSILLFPRSTRGNGLFVLDFMPGGYTEAEINVKAGTIHRFSRIANSRFNCNFLKRIMTH